MPHEYPVAKPLQRMVLVNFCHTRTHFSVVAVVADDVMIVISKIIKFKFSFVQIENIFKKKITKIVFSDIFTNYM